MGFKLPVGLKFKEIIALIDAKEKIPPESDIIEADGIEAEKIGKNASRMVEDLIFKTKTFRHKQT